MTLSKFKWLLLALIVLPCLMWPNTSSAAKETIIQMKKVEGFEILVDVSGSMDENWATGNCTGLDKLQVQFEVIRRFSAGVPQLHYVGAMRAFGITNLITGDADFTRIVYPPQKFNSPAFVAEVNKLKPTTGITPMGPATVHAGRDLDTMAGRKALVIISDFRRSMFFGNPTAEAQKLRDEYNHQVRVYTIVISENPKQVAQAREIAAATGGVSFDGCVLFQNQYAMDEAIKTIFYDEYRVAAPPEAVEAVAVADIDSDFDGVPNLLDKCPNTPLGAIVDARGCWLAAYGKFFDFDKSDVKPQYFAHLQRIADVLKAYPKLEVTLEGHTDQVGTPEYNLALGERRVLAIRDVLSGYGVEKSRLKYKSYGETMPIADNDTEEGRLLNRRVEINVAQPNATP
ncbi:MAG: OmpA family protein [Pseudomonadota bacterium]